MVKVREDLTGRQFGRLTVLYQGEDFVKTNGVHEAVWVCQCNCKNHTIVLIRGQSLKSGATQSCGCIHSEMLANRNRENVKRNKYDLSGEYGIGWTINTNREFYFDLKDYDLIKDYCWCEHKSKKDNYVALEAHESNTGKTIRMHYLFNCKGWDHIDRNTFNNRRNNLRPASSTENARNGTIGSNNTSGVIGVYWHSRDNIWNARIGVDGNSIYLGEFINKDDAIRARLNAEVKYFGEFAPQKHLYEQYGITEN